MRLILLIGLLAAPLHATEVIRLSDAQRDAVIAAAANGPERDPVLTPMPVENSSVLNRSLYPEFWGEGGGAPDRKVHGEVAMFAGSGGTFGMAGTAVVPVGETGSAAVSIMRGTSNWGNMSGFSLGYNSNGTPLGGFSGLGAFGGLGWSGYGTPPLWNGLGNSAFHQPRAIRARR